MKIRADFVTNSSSSSYVTLDIHSPLFARMLEDYLTVLDERGELEDDDWGEFSFDFEVKGDHVVCDDESDQFMNVPESINELFSSFLDGISEDNEGYVNLAPLAATLKEHEEEVLDSIESVEWTYESSGWGGDSEDRIYHNYSDAEIDGFKDRIIEQKKWDAEWEAKRKGKSPEAVEFHREDVTEDEVRDYILRSTSNETTSFSYKKGKGPGTHTYSYELSQ